MLSDDEGCGGLRVGDEGGFGQAGQRAGLDAEHGAALLMVPEPGERQQHRVTGLRAIASHHDEKEGLVAAGGDRHLLRREMAPP